MYVRVVLAIRTRRSFKEADILQKIPHLNVISIVAWCLWSNVPTYKEAEIPYVNTVRPSTPEQHLGCAVAMRLDGGEIAGLSRQPRETEAKIRQLRKQSRAAQGAEIVLREVDDTAVLTAHVPGLWFRGQVADKVGQHSVLLNGHHDVVVLDVCRNP